MHVEVLSIGQSLSGAAPRRLAGGVRSIILLVDVVCVVLNAPQI